MKHLKSFFDHDRDKKGRTHRFFFENITPLDQIPVFIRKVNERGKWIIDGKLIDFPYLEPTSCSNNPSYISATQDYLDPNKIQEFLNDKNPYSLYILEVEGKDYLLDGHHRYASAIIRGDKEIPAFRYSLKK